MEDDGQERDENGCVPWCPVRLLDGQAGPRTGMKRAVLRRGATTGTSIGGHGIYGQNAPQEALAGYDDASTAVSRFYPVFWPDAPDVDVEEEEGDHAPMAEPAQPADAPQPQPEAGQGALHDRVICGDSREVLAGMETASVDAIVTDPPYALTSGKNSTKGFMSAAWDNGTVAHDRAFWAEVLRVAKPGAHLVAFGGTRTVHRLACAIEDAGWEIRDSLYLLWCHGQGFPKSADISKHIDKAAGAERLLGEKRVSADGTVAHDRSGKRHEGWERPWRADPDAVDRNTRHSYPATDAARQWHGWGTALKPSAEPIVYARKPLTIVPLEDRLIVEATALLEVLLWSLLPARFVDEISTLSPRDCGGDPSGSVRLLAAVLHGLQSPAQSGLMATFSSQETAATFWNIAWLWSSILDALSPSESTCTTATGSSLTIALKTLNSLLSASMDTRIVGLALQAGGLWSSAGSAHSPLSAPSLGWTHIPRPSVAEPVISSISPAISSTLVSIAEALSLPLLPMDGASAHGGVPTERATSSDATAPARPSAEPIVLARKPLAEPNVAANVLAYGTGALNIDACRLPTDVGDGTGRPKGSHGAFPFSDDSWGNGPLTYAGGHAGGRWPPNTLLSHVGGPDGCRPAGVRRVRDGGRERRASGAKGRGGVYGTSRVYDSGKGTATPDGYETVDAYHCVEGCPVAALDEQAGPRTSGGRSHQPGDEYGGNWHNWQGRTDIRRASAAYDREASTGSASRYFPTFPGADPDPDPEDAVPFRYEPKASRRDRGEGNDHSTVKPTALMAWLCKLATPPGGVVLDCFAGSGSTLVACVREGFGFIGIEQDSHYCDIARRRIAHAQQQRHGPLFANADAEKDA